MTVTDVRTDREALTMTITAQFEAPVELVWRVWADPQLLGRWWGPPTHPATFTDHDLSPGGRVSYYMTGPEGEQYHGWWLVRSVQAPHALEFQDGFGDADGAPDPEMPTNITHVSLQARPDGGTTMTLRATFESLEGMEQQLAMGMEEGITLAAGQIDALLAR